VDYGISFYVGRSEMMWAHLTCSNSITLRLNTKQMLAKHTPFLGYTSLPSSWKLPDGLKEPFSRGAAIILTDSHLCRFLATVETLYPAEHSAACRYFLSLNCR